MANRDRGIRNEVKAALIGLLRSTGAFGGDCLFEIDAYELVRRLVDDEIDRIVTRIVIAVAICKRHVGLQEQRITERVRTLEVSLIQIDLADIHGILIENITR